MGILRLYIRLLLGVSWTLAVWCVRLAVWPSALFSEALDRRLRRRLVRGWGRGLARIIGMTVVVKGAPPPPPFYLVANHLSYIDVWLLAHTAGCAFVARGDVEHWPLIGIIAKSVYVLFIDRESRKDAVRVNRLIEHALSLQDGIAVFPESRISRGIDVEPFKSALIEPAVANKVPIHYATISYATAPGCPPASRVIGWWRPEPFFHHLFRLLRCRAYTATIEFGDTPLTGEDRKQLARELREAVRKPFVPLA
ncbi:MAG: 1-acyl-sn-glycerol-3-phosphate acyltransferase [Candidatus Hydrogenedentes bacterium]|nr:1-acyl-sn-glycerol-3-phosphate acyltransferase [Candidatus Hydrogenedentota bacterium]